MWPVAANRVAVPCPTRAICRGFTGRGCSVARRATKNWLLRACRKLGHHTRGSGIRRLIRGSRRRSSISAAILATIGREAAKSRENDIAEVGII